MDEEAIPILRVATATAALAWYQRLGFAQEWEHRFEPGFAESSGSRSAVQPFRYHELGSAACVSCSRLAALAGRLHSGGFAGWPG